MKKANIFISAIIALTMVSCQEVPEDVKSRTEEKQSIIEEAESKAEERTGELVYISSGEVAADAEKGLSQKYSNFTLAENIKIEVPETIVKCDFKQVGGFNEKTDMLVERIFGKETAEAVSAEVRPKRPDDPYSMETRGIDDDDRQIFLNIWDNGFLCFIKPPFYEKYGGDTGQRVEIYHVDRGDDLSDTYMLNGRKVSVAEAVEAAQKWLDENYADIEPEYYVRVKTVIARKNKYGEYALDFTVDRVYKGIELDSLCDVYSKEKDEHGKLIYRSYFIDLKMKNGTDIDYFTNGTSIIAPVEKGTLDKIVSLKSALEHIEKTFADFENPLTINDINLKYVLTPDNDYKNRMPFEWYDVLNAGRIVWEFVIDVPMEQLMHEENGKMVYISDSIGDIRKYIYIDAETGEMDFEFDHSRLLQ